MSCAPIGSMLCAKEPGPTKPVTNPQVGCYKFETTYAGNVGNDMGVSTVGYRAARYNLPEWHEANYAKFYQSFADRDNAERVRNASEDTIKETNALAKRTQDETVKKLSERLKDLHFWKGELLRELNDTKEETKHMIAMKTRLEKGLKACECAMMICTENMNCRDRREGIDLAQDEVELNLLKEIEVINNVQDLLKRTIREAEEQIKRNHDRQMEIEADWSNKHESDDIDTFNIYLQNNHTNKQFYAGAAKFLESQSTAESWAQYSHDNITRAEHERMSSIQMRTLSSNVLQDTSRDVRQQADAVELAFQQRLDLVEDTRKKLEENLIQTCKDIVRTEGACTNLHYSIKNNENPMKVAQTRLRLREARPGVDQCRDMVQYHLVAEVHELARTMDILMQKLKETEHALKDLQDQRMSLEKDITIKTNSLFIDQQKCMAHRARYPSMQKLLGLD